MATVRILRSTTAAAVPSSLVSGQIAINESDGKLFYRNGSGVVTALATGGGGSTQLYTYSTTASFPGTGSTTALYLSIDSGRVYQWTGSVYAEVGPVGGGSSPATVTIPATGDQYWAYVSLLMQGDGATSDSSSASRVVTVNGTVTATGTAKFGSNSLSFSGSSAYLTVAGDSAFSLPGDFCIESWVYFNAAPSAYAGAYGACIAATYPAGSGGWQLRVNGNSSSYTTVNLYTGATDLNWSGTFYLNQWHHVAVARSSGSIRAFVDGTQVGSTVSNTDDMNSYGGSVYIGRLNLSPYFMQLNGLLDDLRITKGIARYSASFTPPTAGFATGTYTAAKTLPVVYS